MMPVIRVSDATWERLKRYARPFEDKPEDIVNLALDALDAKNGAPATVPTTSPRPAARKSARSAEKTPQRSFREPLLQVLKAQGGAADTTEVRRILEKELEAKLLPADLEPVSSGDPRWWNAVCWMRNDLVKEGLIDNDGERGVWKLTARGMAE